MFCKISFLHGRFPTKCILEKAYKHQNIKLFYLLLYAFSYNTTNHNQSMLSVCFSVAQMIAFLSSTDSTYSRCGITDITCCITEHFLVNCNCVQTCKLLFQRMYSSRIRFYCVWVYLLSTQRGVCSSIVWFDPHLESLLQGKIDMFLAWGFSPWSQQSNHFFRIWQPANCC